MGEDLTAGGDTGGGSKSPACQCRLQGYYTFPQQACSLLCDTVRPQLLAHTIDATIPACVRLEGYVENDGATPAVYGITAAVEILHRSEGNDECDKLVRHTSRSGPRASKLPHLPDPTTSSILSMPAPCLFTPPMSTCLRRLFAFAKPGFLHVSACFGQQGFCGNGAVVGPGRKERGKRPTAVSLSTHRFRASWSMSAT